MSRGYYYFFMLLWCIFYSKIKEKEINIDSNKSIDFIYFINIDISIKTDIELV